MKFIHLLLFILLLLIATYSDIKKREIPDTICIGIGILSLFDFHLLGILSAVPFLIGAFINPNGMGGGDIKLTGAVGLFLGFWSTIYGIIIALSAASTFYLVKIIFMKYKNKGSKREIRNGIKAETRQGTIQETIQGTTQETIQGSSQETIQETGQETRQVIRTEIIHQENQEENQEVKAISLPLAPFLTMGFLVSYFIF